MNKNLTEIVFILDHSGSMSCAITSMRSGAPMSADGKAPIEADYKTRKGEKD